MKLLLEIHDDDLGLERFKISKYEERIGARAVILNKGKIALLYAGKKNHHKLPGGKAELNESINDCLMREVFEETKITDYSSNEDSNRQIHTSKCLIRLVT